MGYLLKTHYVLSYFPNNFQLQCDSKPRQIFPNDSKLLLKISKDRDFLTSLGSLFQDNITLSFIKFLLIRVIFADLLFPGLQIKFDPDLLKFNL